MNLKIILLLILALSFSGCATTHYLGEGIVIATKPLPKKNYSPADKTEKGLKLGGITGAIVGGVVGAAAGSAPGVFLGLKALIIFTVMGSVGGAAALGLTGFAVGGTLGYAVDLAVHQTLYEYKVKSLNNAQIITVTQYSSKIAENTAVHILEKGGSLFIRK